MASFLEKLKRGMGVEITSQENKEITVEENNPEPKRKKRVKTAKEPLSIQTISFAAKDGEEPEPIENKKELVLEPPKTLKIDAKKVEIDGIDKPSFVKVADNKKDWFDEPAGELAIDVFQTEQNLIIQTAIAGIKPENLEITVEKDIVAIKGIRQKPAQENSDYFTKECYWGPFAREIIVPVEVDPNRIEAIMQEGILTVKMPKILREKKRTITIKV